jgi:hypothetical protein
MAHLGICPFFLFIWNLVWKVCDFMRYIIHSNVGEDSSVTEYGLDIGGSVLRRGGPALGSTQPPIQWVLGALPSGVKQLGHEVGSSSPSSAKVKIKRWRTYNFECVKCGSVG